MNRFIRGPTYGVCGRHGEWIGPERCPACLDDPPPGPRERLVVTEVDRDRGEITFCVSDEEGHA